MNLRETAPAPGQDLPVASPFEPALPQIAGASFAWHGLSGSGKGLVIASAARRHGLPMLVVVPDMPGAERLEAEIEFYRRADDEGSVVIFPDLETLPYDVFSPHRDIIADRLAALYRLPGLRRGIVIVPVTTLMSRLPPQRWLDAQGLLIDKGERIDRDALTRRLEEAGYQHVGQVMEHGEYAMRGSLVDIFPTGSRSPFRIDLFDDEVDSLRTFDPESQRSTGSVESIEVLPAREFPLQKEDIRRFKQAWREAFPGDPLRSPIYRGVAEGNPPGGIEYYLPLFFDRTASLFDYLPRQTVCLVDEASLDAAQRYWEEIGERYELRRLDEERPALAPERLFFPPQWLKATLAERIHGHFGSSPSMVGADRRYRFAIGALDGLAPAESPAARKTTTAMCELRRFVDAFRGRVLIVAESAGRRERLLELLGEAGLRPRQVDDWTAFLQDDSAALAITVAPLDASLIVEEPRLAIVAEATIFGEQVMQRRRRRRQSQVDAEAVIRNLTELAIGTPVVHEDHGVGRYLGLKTITTGGMPAEFLQLEYADGDTLYVPVTALHLISRYSGIDPEQAPLHRLGSQRWQKARRKAAERARDVAAELLDIYARRQAREGHAYPPPDEAYAAFAAAFPFEETPDQEEAIRQVLADMSRPTPMDRLVCGDVGFGKTEVAMRAAFQATYGGRQVAVLVPTTLLAQQHYQNFCDRFADLPVRIEVLSRFRSAREQAACLEALAEGQIDIVIGTHKLIQKDVRFKRLGLVIIDEEHRFGVRQKERLRALRSEVDVLALTATPIPRTLNMAVSGIRDLSIIATPPQRRLAVRTFVREWEPGLLREACLREIHRGGQVYFLHNEVRNIERIARELGEIVPEARIRIAHGQMPERELEQIMLDFYHQRFNILLCTTIIESGIDVPNANTIVINRADRLGLAQLYQLRGRVGRSHHQAYAYLIAPPLKRLSRDARKRLEAIESIEDLGAGFTLATYDLEIRGAGEFLGEEQSGQIQEVGLSLYTQLLERAVESIRAGRTPDTEAPFESDSEVELGVPTLIPEDYVADVHQRLVLYKRIASARTQDELDELQVELIDRFGLLPDAVKALFAAASLKLQAMPLGVTRIVCDDDRAILGLSTPPRIDPAGLIAMVQAEPERYRLLGGDRFAFPLATGTDLTGRCRSISSMLDRLSTMRS